MTDFTTRPAFEAKTHELIHNHMNKEGTTATWETYAVIQAIKAMWISSATPERFAIVASALSCQTITTEAAQAVLTQLVRAKVMRSRKASGSKVYEVNY